MLTARVAAIDAVLPQTQCGQCGYAGCLPYAEAIACGAPIDRCPPGGVTTLLALAKLVDQQPAPDVLRALAQNQAPKLAIIDANACIGCTKCIQACPVDAIVGAAKMLHVVLTDQCTGCELCVEPCPVDCISMQSIPIKTYDPAQARRQFNAKQQRQQKIKHTVVANPIVSPVVTSVKQAYIQAAVQRAQQKKTNTSFS